LNIFKEEKEDLMKEPKEFKKRIEMTVEDVVHDYERKIV
jgi:hypothetical protein